jgi:hypothetical protein
MKKFIARVALVSVATLTAGPAAANHQWGTYHWANNGTGVSLDLKHAFRDPDNWMSYYTEAIGDWESSGSPLALTDKGPSGTDPKKCSPIAGQILVCSESYGFRGWLGVAQIWLSGDHITQGITKLNNSYYSTATYNTDGWRDLVMCQEIGHDFGLGHQDETFDNQNLGTCMDYTNAPDGGGSYGLPNRAPNAHDYDVLNSTAMYGSAHSDGSSGGGGDDGGGCNPRSPKCSGQDAFSFREVGRPVPSSTQGNSGEWGRAIGEDGAGRPDTFLLDLGNGRRKITHVFWVPGFKPESRHLGDSH